MYGNKLLDDEVFLGSQREGEEDSLDELEQNGGFKSSRGNGILGPSLLQ